VNQVELQAMVAERILDAKTLLEGGRWEFSYYVAGYALECALKSCVLARMTLTGWVFQEKWDAKVCLSHDLERLVNLAGLTAELNLVLATNNPTFAGNWGTVIGWKTTSRYEPRTEAEAKGLFEAITDIPDGVLNWLKMYW